MLKMKREFWLICYVFKSMAGAPEEEKYKEILKKQKPIKAD